MKTSVKNGMLINEEERLEFFIWDAYLRKKAASITGSKVNSLGLLPVRIFKGGKYESKTFMNPTFTQFYPSDVQMRKEKVYPESIEQPYMVMVFEKGDQICPVETIQDLDNADRFTSMMLDGQLDTNIPYNLLTKAWIQNMISNDTNLNVPVTNLEIVRKKICRDRNDITKTFASVLAKKPNTSLIAYQFASIRELCGVDSVFTGLSFEDFNTMLAYSLNITSSQREQNISPLESIIKY